MMISEVTTPPYFARVEDLHVEVTVVPLRTKKEVSLEKLLRSSSPRKSRAGQHKSKLLMHNKV